MLPHQKMITDKLQASDMMACQIVALPLRPTVADVIKVLVTYNHSTYAVTTEPELADRGEPFKLAGVIRKSQMVRLLKHRLGVIRKVVGPSFGYTAVLSVLCVASCDGTFTRCSLGIPIVPQSLRTHVSLLLCLKGWQRAVFPM